MSADDVKAASAEPAGNNGQMELSAEELADRDAAIVKQVEYYFGDFNLPRDKFLQVRRKMQNLLKSH